MYLFNSEQPLVALSLIAKFLLLISVGDADVIMSLLLQLEKKTLIIPTVRIFPQILPIFLYNVPMLNQMSHFFMNFVPIFDSVGLAPMHV